MLFTTCTLCPTTPEPPWAAITLPTAEVQRQANGTPSMTPGENRPCGATGRHTPEPCSPAWHAPEVGSVTALGLPLPATGSLGQRSYGCMVGRPEVTQPSRPSTLLLCAPRARPLTMLCLSAASHPCPPAKCAPATPICSSMNWLVHLPVCSSKELHPFSLPCGGPTP